MILVTYRTGDLPVFTSLLIQVTVSVIVRSSGFKVVTCAVVGFNAGRVLSIVQQQQTVGTTAAVSLQVTQRGYNGNGR